MTEQTIALEHGTGVLTEDGRKGWITGIDGNGDAIVAMDGGDVDTFPVASLTRDLTAKRPAARAQEAAQELAKLEPSAMVMELNKTICATLETIAGNDQFGTVLIVALPAGVYVTSSAPPGVTIDLLDNAANAVRTRDADRSVPEPVPE